LANLKKVLDLDFHHYEAGGDARAAALVVLRVQALSHRSSVIDALRVKHVQLSWLFGDACLLIPSVNRQVRFQERCDAAWMIEGKILCGCLLHCKRSCDCDHRSVQSCFRPLCVAIATGPYEFRKQGSESPPSRSRTGIARNRNFSKKATV